MSKDLSFPFFFSVSRAFYSISFIFSADSLLDVAAFFIHVCSIHKISPCCR